MSWRPPNGRHQAGGEGLGHLGGERLSVADLARLGRLHPRGGSLPSEQAALAATRARTLSNSSSSSVCVSMSPQETDRPVVRTLRGVRTRHHVGGCGSPAGSLLHVEGQSGHAGILALRDPAAPAGTGGRFGFRPGYEPCPTPGGITDEFGVEGLDGES